VFTALDKISDAENPQVRVALFDVDGATGVAAAASTGRGPSGSYLTGTGVVDHSLMDADPDENGSSDLGLLTESTSSGLVFLAPATGAVLPGGFGLAIATGGISLDGF